VSTGKTFGLNRAAMISENKNNIEIEKEIQEFAGDMIDGSIKDSTESCICTGTKRLIPLDWLTT
jgi:hypothetical protein